MLTHLHVKNFALIKELDLELNKGMTVLTGETGAGKSILIGSMDAIAGGKLTKDIIRRGEVYALIEMIFELPKDILLPIYEQYDLLYDDPKEIILSRRYSENGRSVYRINNQTVTAKVMAEVARKSIDIHSQHEHQSLLKPEQHIRLVDQFLGKEIQELKGQVKEKVAAYRRLQAKLSEGTLDEQHRTREIDFLKFEIEEIEGANLEPGEDVQLMNDYKVLSNAKKIVKNLSDIDGWIHGERQVTLESLIEQVREKLGAIRDFDEGLEQMAVASEQIEELIYELSRDLEHYSDQLDMDHENLEAIEQRLHVINTLKQKYGDTLEEIFERLGEKQEQLDHYLNFDRNVKAMKEEMLVLEKAILQLCQQLHEKRLKGGKAISKEIEQVLYDLNFDYAKVAVDVTKKEQFGQDGYDQVTIMIGTNKNEGIKPLHKIASGGELSRVMLAIKSLFADMDQIDTLVFDEIDTGISGRTAQKVAEKMALLAKQRQLICITHLPQISAMAQWHVLIKKETIGDRVITQLTPLTEKGIQEELARMIGGAEITENTLQAAKEMKEMARKISI